MWYTLDLLFEAVPEGALVGAGVGLVFFAGGVEGPEALDVFADVEFGVEVGEGGGACCEGWGGLY